MKKRILLFAVMVVSLCLMLAIGVSAAADDYFGVVEIIDNDEDGISDIDITTRIPTVKEKAEGVHGSDEARVTVTCTCAAGKHTFPTYYISSKNDGTTLYRLDFTALNAVLGEYCGNTAGLGIANITAYEAPNGYGNSWAGLFHENGSGTFRGTSIKYISFAKQDTLVMLSGANNGKNWVSSSPVVEIDFGALQNVPSWFAESCKSLVSVTIPDTVLTIDGQAFRNCSSLTTVNISKTSNLTGFAVEAFGNCSSLIALYIPDSLTTLNIGGGNVGPFNGCSKLYFVNEPGTTEKPSIYYFPENLSDVSGEAIKNCGSLNDVLVFGEKVKSLNNAWAFQNSKTVVVFLGDMEAITTSSWAVTKIYFANANDKSSSDIATYSNSKTAVFCASESDISKHMASPKHSSIEKATCYSNEKGVTRCFCTKVLSEGETPNTMLTTHNYIDDFDCTTPNLCENFGEGKCDKFLDAEALEHIEKHAVAYADGFAKSGLHTVWCDNEGCKALDNEITLGAMIFTSGGYSTNANGGLAGGWTVDTDLVTLFNDYNEKDVQFGIFMVNPSHLASERFMTGYMPNLADGKSGALVVEMTGTEHSNFAFQISGFNSEELKKLELVITAYAYVEGEDIEYIQDANTVCKVTTLDYADGSLYTVTYEKASSELSPVSVEAIVPTIKKDNF